MKERELREAAECKICGRKFGASGVPMFWRVTIERHCLKQGALSRQAGLEMMMGGNVALAQVMGANEDMTGLMTEPVTFTVCETCGSEPHSVAELAERRESGS